MKDHAADAERHARGQRGGEPEGPRSRSLPNGQPNGRCDVRCSDTARLLVASESEPHQRCSDYRRDRERAKSRAPSHCGGDGSHDVRHPESDDSSARQRHSQCESAPPVEAPGDRTDENDRRRSQSQHGNCAVGKPEAPERIDRRCHGDRGQPICQQAHRPDSRRAKSVAQPADDGSEYKDTDRHQGDGERDVGTLPSEVRLQWAHQRAEAVKHHGVHARREADCGAGDQQPSALELVLQAGSP